MISSPQKVIVIIPTYNEALVIQKTLEQVFLATQDTPDFIVEILVFDSASTDHTQEVVKKMLPQYAGKLHLQAEACKTGLGSAYFQAMQFALNDLKADVVVEFDADLSHQPQYLPHMLGLIKICDVVLGSRYISGGSIPKNWDFRRKLLSVLGNQVARLLLTRRYQDFTSGFRMTRRDVLLSILPDKFLSDHYAYKLHLLWLLHLSGATIKEFPIEFIDRAIGMSKLPANSIKDALRVIFKLRFSQIIHWIKT